MSTQDMDTTRDVLTESWATKNKDELVAQCNNCGRRIQPQQKRIDIFNTRHKTYEHYHEDYRGCFESTRPSGRRIVINRRKPWLNTWLDDNYQPNKLWEE